MDFIQEDAIKRALSVIDVSLVNINGKITNVSSVSEELSGAWKSENANTVKEYVEQMGADLAQLHSSIANIKSKVDNVVTAIVAADAVKINKSE